MPENAKNPKKMKVFPKGQVIIPVDLRRMYNINIGDRIEFVTFQDGILLKPSKQKPENRSLTDELYGMLRSYVKGKETPGKDAINAITESGFVEGWTE
ncbi:MAG: AbrB/MazE/SpoVT family DNA-binding domain-containing protein [Desulfosarcina sp.]|nr:AbrB/MazE/SpoVT family DNA-binding domain-containing protein [Desulfosarcina sp.]MBC2764546.1 AbrB/MazE/SpoVT family DNA-binding domain-containing protein [Desulfosarcina sp.]